MLCSGQEQNTQEDIICFRYTIVRLWEMTVEEVLAMDLVGLFPFLPLTSNGKQRRVIDIMISRLLAAGKTDALWDGYTLAAKVFDKNDREWLKRRFAMLDDFLRDSPAYEDVRTAARLEVQDTFSRALLDIVGVRFPTLEALAKQRVGEIVDADVLANLILKLSLAQTEQEVKKLLNSTLQA